MRFRPRLRSVSRWLRLPPISDRVWVTFRRPMSGTSCSAGLEQCGRSHVLQGQAATSGDRLGTLEATQRVDCRVHDVDGVVRAERLAQHVVDAGALQHGAHRTTGDDAGTGAGRTQQHDAGSLLALDGVRNGALDARDLEEVLLGLLHALGDRGGHLLGLAVADTDGAVAVAHHDERGEAEAAAALDDLCHAVDRDDPLDVPGLLGPRTSTVVTTVAAVVATAASATLGPSHQTSSSQLMITLLQLFARIRSPAPPRGHRRREPRPDRDSCCRLGRTPRTRRRPPWPARQRAPRRVETSLSCPRRSRGGRPPSWTPTPA